MREVYVVMGATGEYSDHQEWCVRAFAVEDQARQLVMDASREAARVLGVDDPEVSTCQDGTPMAKVLASDVDLDTPTNKYDPDMYCSYTGVRYYYEKVPFGLPVTER